MQMKLSTSSPPPPAALGKLLSQLENSLALETGGGGRRRKSNAFGVLGMGEGRRKEAGPTSSWVNKTIRPYPAKPPSWHILFDAKAFHLSREKKI